MNFMQETQRKLVLSALWHLEVSCPKTTMIGLTKVHLTFGIDSLVRILDDDPLDLARRTMILLLRRVLTTGD